MSTRATNWPTTPSRAISAWMIAMNATETPTMNSTSSTGWAMSMPTPRATTPKATTAWAAPSSAAPSQPPSATRQPGWPAASARVDSARIRVKSTNPPIHSARLMKNGASPAP